MERKSNNIRQLDDAFRQNFMGGQIVITNGVNALSDIEKLRLFDLVKHFDDFNEDNDPHGEHDFGCVPLQGKRYFWKIDYYDKDLLYHSPDPTNPEITKRVMTIMRAEEH